MRKGLNKTQPLRTALDSSKVASNPDIDKIFAPLPVPELPTKPRSSSFSKLMANVENYKNPFLEYGKFDAQGNQESPQIVKLRIYLTMCLPDSYIDVLVSPKATVEQSIGLVLFQYCIDRREPNLNGSVHDYCFRHRRLDDDEKLVLFQPLASRDLIKKYYSYHDGHSALELELWRESRHDTTMVKVYYDNNSHTTIQIMGTKVKMEEIFLPALRKKLPRRQSTSLASVRSSYVLEKLHEPGKSIALDSLFEDMNTTEYKLVRYYSKRTSQIESEADTVKGYSRFQSLSYEVFNVQVPERILKRKIDVLLGISEEKIEIDPLTKSTLPPFKHKAESINTQYLLKCEILPDKNVNTPGIRKRLKMTYLTENREPKEFIFETENQAQQIYRKVLFIISQLQSNIRLQYLLKDKHTPPSRKTSFFSTSSYGSSSKST